MDALGRWLLYDERNPMFFTAPAFWGFFAVVLAGVALTARRPRARNLLLVVASLFFYWKAGGHFFPVLVFTLLVNYALARAIGAARPGPARNLALLASVVTNLGTLGYFKYTYLAVDGINAALGTHLQVVNVLALATNAVTGSHFDVARILLPVGISFYTFQSLGYTIDVYRGHVPPIRDFVDCACFVTFFPQLVAGPIARAGALGPQLARPFGLGRAEFGAAVFLVLQGLVKKMVIGDYVSLNFVDRVFDAPGSFTGLENLMAVYGYAIQIYCDFSGYTDIAIGVAALLGFRLPPNFDSPYRAADVSDFWRRWHISLTRWLWDFVFNPLAHRFVRACERLPLPRRGQEYVAYAATALVTLVLAGLWHGASVGFLLWGALHGAALGVHRAWWLLVRRRRAPRWATVAAVLVTFHFVCFGWILFRARDLRDAGTMLAQITGALDLRLAPQVLAGYPVVFALIAAALAIHWLPARLKVRVRDGFVSAPLPAQALCVALAVFTVVQFKTSALQPFIYFQF
jgi:alginate O-acetyltransferase complex protein AlgI